MTQLDSRITTHDGAEEIEDKHQSPEHIKRYDLIITSERAGYRPPKAAVGALVQQLSFRGFAKPVDEAIAETWTEIYFEPSVASHELFIERAYTSPEPVFNELTLKFTEKPFFCEETETPQRPLYFAIIIHGSRYPTVLGAFKKLFVDTINLHVSVAVRDAQPLEPHKIVPDSEKPVEKKKHERGNGIAGTAVFEV